MNWTMNTIARSLSLLAVVAALVSTTLVRADEPANSPADDEEQAQPSRPVSKWIGVQCEPVDEALAGQLGLESDVGLVVRDVVPDSPAAKAGLRANDVLTAVDGQPLKSIRDLLAAVNVAGEGPRHVERIRAGKHETIDVVPDARPNPAVPAFETVVPDADREALRHWLDQMGRNAGQPPANLRFFHPGVVVPRGEPFTKPDAALPDDMTVTIIFKGKSEPTLRVEQGDKTWNVTADNIGQLPPEVRRALESVLPPPQVLGGPGAIVARPRGPGAVPPAAALERMEKQLEAMNRRLDELRQRLEPAPKDPAPPTDRPSKTDL